MRNYNKGDHLFIVRHYSHTYVAELVSFEGRWGYYRLLSIHTEYKRNSVGASHRGVWISNSSTNNYVGDIVKKEIQLVQHYDQEQQEYDARLLKTANAAAIIIISVLALLVLLLFI